MCFFMALPKAMIQWSSVQSATKLNTFLDRPHG
jgi:hypothetical protein